MGNSQLSTLYSQLSTLYSQFSTLYSQLSTLNSQLSTLNSQLSTFTLSSESIGSGPSDLWTLGFVESIHNIFTLFLGKLHRPLYFLELQYFNLHIKFQVTYVRR